MGCIQQCLAQKVVDWKEKIYTAVSWALQEKGNAVCVMVLSRYYLFRVVKMHYNTKWSCKESIKVLLKSTYACQDKQILF